MNEEMKRQLINMHGKFTRLSLKRRSEILALMHTFKLQLSGESREWWTDLIEIFENEVSK